MARTDSVKLKNLKVKNLLLCLFVSLLYPFFAYISSENGLLALINSMTIIGFVMIAFGIVLSLVFHGDFDVTEYVATRWMHRKTQDYKKTYDKFKADKAEKREGSFNYPLLVGIVLLIAAIILTSFY